MRATQGVRVSSLLLLSVGSASAQPTIQSLGVPQGSTWASPMGVSRDGSVVVGNASNGAFRWTEAGGIQPLPGMTSAVDVSDDGLIVCGTGIAQSGRQHAFLWSSATGAMDLGSLTPGAPHYEEPAWSTAISRDGTAIIGKGASVDGMQNFRWTQATGMQFLYVWMYPEFGDALGVNGNGTVYTGSYGSNPPSIYPRAFRLSGGALSDLGTLTGQWGSSGKAISADGTVIVGYSDTILGPRAIRVRYGSDMEDLGTIHPSSSEAVKTNENGTVVIGNSGLQAFIWTEAMGMVPLAQYAISLGVALDGWELSSVKSISTDASTIVGTGRLHGTFVAWRLTGLNFRTIQGRIVFSGLDLYAAPIPSARIHFRNPTTREIVHSVDAPLDSIGRFRVNLPTVPGLHDVEIKHSHWLRRVVRIDTTQGGVDSLLFPLRNGDVDGDNEIGIGDFALLSASFGSEIGDSRWFEHADLNHDYFVDIADYAVLSQNFGRVGDE